MSYDEHLISMAGGDGEVDLDAITEAAVDAAAKFLLDDNPFNDEDDLWQVPSIRDHYHTVARGALKAAHPALLALVRDQAAKLGRVEALADRLEAEATLSLDVARDLKNGPHSALALSNAALHGHHGITADTHSKRIRAAITATEAGK